MTKDAVEYRAAARALRMTPIEALSWLQIFGMVNDQTSVESAVIKAAAAKMGIEQQGAGGDVVTGERDSSGTTPEQLIATIQEDPNRRRRFLRVLLHKMDRRGYWHPNAARPSSLRHGLAEPESNWVKLAIETLERAGWLEAPPLARRERSDPQMGLARSRRSEILRFVRTGTVANAIVADFIAS
jgi:hypothetical protein